MPFFHRANALKSAARVYPFKQTGQELFFAGSELPQTLSFLLKRGKSAFFQANKGECLLLDGEMTTQDHPAVLLGLGKDLNAENLRQSFGQLSQFARKRGLEELSIDLNDIGPFPLNRFLVCAVCEGLSLGNYSFETFKKSPEGEGPLKAVTFINCDENTWQWIESSQAICDGVFMARDLTNGNAEEITPTYLAELAMTLAERFDSISTTIWNIEKMKSEKLGLTLAVARGSQQAPKVIIAEYKGGEGPHIALIGKGVTFDTGGLCLKPANSMSSMKCDMGGAAAVFGALQAIAQLRLPCRVTMIVPAVENAIGSGSFRPGDVQRACNGMTIEIDNTDAEGRLILGEMLHIASTRYRPDHILDLATLTGAVEVCLGTEAAGLLSNDDQLAKDLIGAGERTHERLWRLPLFQEYKELLKSDIADLKNSGGRQAGTSTAAWFLKEFVGKASWAHLDIAGVAYLDKPKNYHLQYGTGFGVRLIAEWLMSLCSPAL